MKRFSTSCVFYCFLCQVLHTCMILWLYIEKETAYIYRENIDTHTHTLDIMKGRNKSNRK